MEALSSVAAHGQKESHITAVTYYYCILLVHITTFVIVFDNMRELNKGITGIQNKVVKCSVVTSSWHKGGRFSDTKACNSQRNNSRWVSLSRAGRSSALLKRRSLRVTPACKISVSHQLAIVSELWQLTGSQCHSSWKGFSVAAARKFKFDCSRQGFRVPTAGSFLVLQQLAGFQCRNSWHSFRIASADIVQD